MSNTNSSPTISVILPAYNAERYLQDAIDSILKQTFRDFELIILNDGSTDKTEEIILSYTDPRIRYVKNEQNLKLINTLNKGVELAKGKFIARMDADDISIPTRFEEQIKYLTENPTVALVSAEAYMMNELGEITHKSRHYVTHLPKVCRFANIFECQFMHPVCMIRSEVLKEYKYSNEDVAIHVEDYELWSRMNRDGLLMASISEPLFMYRVTEGSICGKYKNLQVEHCLEISYQSYCCILNDKIDKDVYFRLFSKNKSIHSFISMMNLLHKQIKIYINKNRLNKDECDELFRWEGKFLLECSRSSKSPIANIALAFFYHPLSVLTAVRNYE